MKHSNYLINRCILQIENDTKLRNFKGCFCPSGPNMNDMSTILKQMVYGYSNTVGIFKGPPSFNKYWVHYKI